jgi:hypothetical protein
VGRGTVVGHELTAPRRETGVGLQRRSCQHGSAGPPLARQAATCGAAVTAATTPPCRWNGQLAGWVPA